MCIQENILNFGGICKVCVIFLPYVLSYFSLQNFTVNYFLVPKALIYKPKGKL